MAINHHSTYHRTDPIQASPRTSCYVSFSILSSLSTKTSSRISPPNVIPPVDTRFASFQSDQNLYIFSSRSRLILLYQCSIAINGFLQHSPNKAVDSHLLAESIQQIDEYVHITSCKSPSVMLSGGSGQSIFGGIRGYSISRYKRFLDSR